MNKLKFVSFSSRSVQVYVTFQVSRPNIKLNCNDYKLNLVKKICFCILSGKESDFYNFTEKSEFTF